MGMLDGKVAIVTGAGQGIGRCHALELATQGAQVVVNDIGVDRTGEGPSSAPAQQVVDEITSTGGTAVANYDDVSSWTGAEALVNQAIDEFGQLNVLVNNAGILRDSMSFKMTEQEWDSVIAVHLKGHFATSHFAAKYWRNKAKQGDPVTGRIINTASESGLFGNPGQANYAAAKAGIAAMTLVMSRELEKYGVTINAIAPRARTRMTEDLMGGLGAEESPDFDPVAPEHVSPFVAWLATDDAAHVSGQVFVVWGDEVQITHGWEIVGTIKAGERSWKMEELTDASKELFTKRDPGVPAFGIPVVE